MDISQQQPNSVLSDAANPYSMMGGHQSDNSGAFSPGMMPNYGKMGHQASGNPNGVPSSAQVPSGPTGTPMLRSLVENGYSHPPPPSSQPLLERDPCAKILDVNAQLILQINQAMMENRPEVIQELMPLLTKNISFLNSLAEQVQSQLEGTSQAPNASARISQSPLPVRPSSQGTPPHMSPPPSSSSSQTSIPTPAPNGQFPPYQPYGPPQARTSPVYSPLTQSTHGQSRSPNLPFQQQAPQNGPTGFSRAPVFPHNNPNQYNQGPSSVPQQQSSGMPPPPLQQQQYAYQNQPPAPQQNYNSGYNPYQGQESNDSNYTSMPPPQMQPRRPASSQYRPNQPDARQMSYQSQQRPYMDPYANSQAGNQNQFQPTTSQSYTSQNAGQPGMYPTNAMSGQPPPQQHHYFRPPAPSSFQGNPSGS